MNLFFLRTCDCAFAKSWCLALWFVGFGFSSFLMVSHALVLECNSGFFKLREPPSNKENLSLLGCDLRSSRISSAWTAGCFSKQIGCDERWKAHRFCLLIQCFTHIYSMLHHWSQVCTNMFFSSLSFCVFAMILDSVKTKKTALSSEKARVVGQKRLRHPHQDQMWCPTRPW